MLRAATAGVGTGRSGTSQMLKVITKVQSDSRELNQAQDNLIRVLNPILPLMLLVPREVVTTANRPSASVDNYLSLIRVKDSGQPERIQWCLQNSSGSYGWADLSIAPL
jgi:hypothetical protein